MVRDFGKSLLVALYVILMWAALDALAVWLFGLASDHHDYGFGFFVSVSAAWVAMGLRRAPIGW